jgi:voltage-gated potassium channel
MPPEGVVQGRGTEAETLEQADIQRAVGLVAGTDDDANNLSIIMTARTLNPELFVVARENHLDNQELFERWVPTSSCTRAPSSPTASGCCSRPRC